MSTKNSIRDKMMIELSEIPRIAFLKRDNREIEFEIFTLSSLFSRQNRLNHSIEKPHRVRFYNIIYITKGNGIHHIDFLPYTYSKGSLLFISQGQVQAFEINPEVDGFLMLFTENFLAKNLIHSEIVSLYRLYNYHLPSPVMQPHETKGDIFTNLINEIHREYNFPDTFAKEEILRLLLKLLLLKAERIQHPVVTQAKNAEWFARFSVFKDHLEKHYAMTRNVKEYAKMLNISTKHLNTICKSISGVTTKTFIDNFMILEIKRHLATTNSSVKELTYAFGFDEPTNFVKYFKRHTGQSPTQLKKTFTK